MMLKLLQIQLNNNERALSEAGFSGSQDNAMGKSVVLILSHQM